MRRRKTLASGAALLALAAVFAAYLDPHLALDLANLVASCFGVNGLPSDWLLRWSHLLAPGAAVLDVACGSGRHVRWLAARGCRVTAIDRDAAALAQLAGIAETVVADLEAGPWPLPGRRFDAVLVTNYLWRPLVPALRASLADRGVYIHETFADGHTGRPSRPEFRLRRGELLALATGLTVVAYEDGMAGEHCVQRIVACSGGASGPAKIVP